MSFTVTTRVAIGCLRGSGVSPTPPACPHPTATSPTNPTTTSAVRGEASLVSGPLADKTRAYWPLAIGGYALGAPDDHQRTAAPGQHPRARPSPSRRPSRRGNGSTAAAGHVDALGWRM